MFLFFISYSLKKPLLNRYYIIKKKFLKKAQNYEKFDKTIKQDEKKKSLKIRSIRNITSAWSYGRNEGVKMI